MPKGRHLKPDFFTDRHIVSVSPLARLLYQGLWCYAADCGHLDDQPVEFKLRILPADNCDVEGLLQELVEQRRIVRENGVIYVPTIAKHGRIDKRYETACEACKSRREHDERKPPQDPTHDVPTTGPRSDHDGSTRAGTPQHDADGDGDGDGDGYVMVIGAAKSPAKRKHQLPNDWQPNDQHRAYAADNLLSITDEAEQFRDHHRAKGTTMLDWDASFRTWLRNAVKWRKDAPEPPRRLPHATELEDPPPGLSDAEYADWYADQKRKRA